MTSPHTVNRLDPIDRPDLNGEPCLEEWAEGQPRRAADPDDAIDFLYAGLFVIIAGACIAIALIAAGG